MFGFVSITMSQGSENLEKWLKNFDDVCDSLGIIVVGVTGTGVSTLINNLLGYDVAKIGDVVCSEISVITEYKITVNGVPVCIYDTPGLLDTSGKKGYLEMAKKVLDKGEIHVIIYCFRMNETRLKTSFNETFQLYNSIGLDLSKTIFALTFADAITARSAVRNAPGFNMPEYFNRQLAEWHRIIKQALCKTVHLSEEIADQIKVYPTTDDVDYMLPNGKPWYNPLWLGMIQVLPPYAAIRYVEMHKDNIVLEVEDDEATPVQLPIPPPLFEDKQPVKAVSMSMTELYKPKIVLSGEDREQFERIIGEKVKEGISKWATAKSVGSVPARATALTAGAAVAVVAAPVVAAGALVSLPFVAVGAAVAGIFNIIKRKKKK